jgi:hypothetical protein
VIWPTDVAGDRPLCRTASFAGLVDEAILLEQDVTTGRDRRRTGRIYCSLVPPYLEPALKKPLGAALLTAAAVATLAMPAGAAAMSSNTTWTHQTLHCSGRKSATWVQKIQNGDAVQGWYDNKCGHQYLTLSWCNSSGQCGAKDFPPHSKGTFTAGTPATAGLASDPTCPDSDICAF